MDKLIHAVQHGDFPYVENSIENQKVSPDALDDESCSILHWAAINNRFEIASYLIRKHANVNIVGGVNAEIPLQWAVRHPRSFKLLFHLIENGSNIHHCSVHGLDALFLAVQGGIVNTVYLLLQKGANPNTVDNNGDTPLLWLVNNENAVERMKLIRLLMSFHANVCAINTRNGNNVFHLMILKEHGHFDIMLGDAFYTAAGSALMSAKNKDGLTPTQLAYKVKMPLAVSFFNDAYMYTTLPPYTTIVASAVAVVLVFVIFHFFGLLWGSGLLVPLFFAWQSVCQQCIINAQSRWSCGWAWGVVATITSTYYIFLSLDLHYLSSLYFTANVIVICFSLYATMNSEPANISHMGATEAAKEELTNKMLQAEEQMAADPQKGSAEVTICTTCLVDKSLASIHCAKCNLCVVNLDHHCPFVCNCVGRGNRRLFVLFTGSASLGCAYFAAVSLYLQYTKYCPDAKGMLYNLLAVESCMHSIQPTVVYVTILSAAVSFWIFCLFLGQLNFVATETTTFQVLRYGNNGVGTCCSIRAMRNIATFLSTGHYNVSISQKLKDKMSNKSSLLSVNGAADNSLNGLEGGLSGPSSEHKCKSCNHDHNHGIC